MTNLIRRYEMKETANHGECIVTLEGIGWELYSIKINGHEEQRVVGLEYAMNALEDHCDPDNTEWVRTDEVSNVS